MRCVHQAPLGGTPLGLFILQAQGVDVVIPHLAYGPDGGGVVVLVRVPVQRHVALHPDEADARAVILAPVGDLRQARAEAIGLPTHATILVAVVRLPPDAVAVVVASAIFLVLRIDTRPL